jgi:hypothetical protein|tara:strand:+ start:748 stop:1398 length:651 start_codon:yes stop_codon:yes gene_type:complete
MKLITEMNEDIKITEELNEATSEKSYFIEGIFMQAEQKNRNGRVYPKEVLMNEVDRYNKEYVAKNRALGELNHPQGPTVNLDRVSHMIKELRQQGDDVYGKAKIMDTPMGDIAKNLIKEGAKLGVSSRGMGSLKQNKSGVNEVQKDFMLAAVDIVADPSAPNAFVNGIMEGAEWVWDGGVLREKQISEYHKEISKANKAELEEKCLSVFTDFISKL